MKIHRFCSPAMPFSLVQCFADYCISASKAFSARWCTVCTHLVDGSCDKSKNLGPLKVAKLSL